MSGGGRSGKGPQELARGFHNAAATTEGIVLVIRNLARNRAVPSVFVFFVLWLLAPGILRAAESDTDRPTVIVVAGAHGDDAFAADFELQLATWADVSRRANANHVAIGGLPAGVKSVRGRSAGAKSMIVVLDGALRAERAKPDSADSPAEIERSADQPANAASGDSDRDRLKAVLVAEPKEGKGELWLILIGHGTFDGKQAKLNLTGPDVSADELAEWLDPFRRPLAVIDTTSASAPFMARLAAKDRVIVTSTRSGFEQNYARFGRFLAEALPDPRSDLDKDGQVSLLEAFLSASHRTSEFYATEGRLATEHALVDDNGDGLGTPADWFKGVRAVKRARDDVSADGVRAHQFHLVRSLAEQQLSPAIRERRDELEREIGRLREAKAEMSEDVYYQKLEKILLQLAELYDQT